MIFRALFWVAVVAVMMPHEPDLGLGRPGMGASMPGTLISKLTGMVEPGQSACKDDEMACVAASGVLGKLQSLTIDGLAGVKAQLDEAKREREARHSG